MGTSQIRVSEEAKDRLESMKREGESYADVVDRLLEGRDGADWRDSSGLWGDSAGEIREQTEKNREDRKDLIHRDR